MKIHPLESFVHPNKCYKSLRLFFTRFMLVNSCDSPTMSRNIAQPSCHLRRLLHRAERLPGNRRIINLYQTEETRYAKYVNQRAVVLFSQAG